MGDLMAFYTTLTGAVGAKNLFTERATAAVAFVEIDKGMAAKIREVQLEGNGVGKIDIQYSTDGGATWRTIKGFAKFTAAVAERFEYQNRPLVIEAWNDTTRFRVNEEAGSAAGLQVILNVEFCDMEKE